MKKCVGIVIIVVIATGCSATPQKNETATPSIDPPIGAILRQYAIQRSLQECKAKALNDERCKQSIDHDQRHLESVNARMEVLLMDPRTNLCDLVRFAGSCANPVYTLGDLADCLQVSPDRAEALNSGRFVLKVDPHGCPTDAK